MAAATRESTGPHCSSTLRRGSPLASARVGPMLRMATGMLFCTAASTSRNADSVEREEPATRRPEALATREAACCLREVGTTSPKKTTSGFTIPALHSGHPGTLKEEKSVSIAASPSGRRGAGEEDEDGDDDDDDDDDDEGDEEGEEADLEEEAGDEDG